MKKSKLQRKYINAMRGMADVPWPARARKYPGTFAPQLTDGRCPRLVTVRHLRRRGWRGLVDLIRFKRPVVQPVVCGAPLVLVPHSALRCGPIRRKR